MTSTISTSYHTKIRSGAYSEVVYRQSKSDSIFLELFIILELMTAFIMRMMRNFSVVLQTLRSQQTRRFMHFLIKTVVPLQPMTVFSQLTH